MPVKRVPLTRAAAACSIVMPGTRKWLSLFMALLYQTTLGFRPVLLEFTHVRLNRLQWRAIGRREPMHDAAAFLARAAATRGLHDALLGIQLAGEMSARSAQLDDGHQRCRVRDC